MLSSLIFFLSVSKLDLWLFLKLISYVLAYQRIIQVVVINISDVSARFVLEQNLNTCKTMLITNLRATQKRSLPDLIPLLNPIWSLSL